MVCNTNKEVSKMHVQVECFTQNREVFHIFFFYPPGGLVMDWAVGVLIPGIPSR